MFNLRNGLAAGAAMLLAFAVSPTFAVGQCVAPPSGMTNWWTADNHIFDIIGGEHGALQGGATFAAGRVAQAFSLDGANDYVLVPNDPTAAFNFDGSLTIDAWIYLKSPPPDFAPVLSKWNDIGVNQRSYFLAVEQHLGFPRVRFDVSGDGLFLNGHSSAIRSSNIIPLNTWTHLAGVFDGTAHTLRIYINGILVTSGQAEFSPTVSAPFVNNEPVLIGAGDLGANLRDFFDGLIDEVELFNRALSQAEIQSIVNAGSAGKIVPISIDIKPGGVPNSINLKSKGTVPVVVLSTETFDATTMNVASILFAGAPVKTKPNGTFMASFEDVNGDGELDLVLHFSTQALHLNQSSTVGMLTGSTTNGRCVNATDSVNIVH